ncbi:telomere-associated protein RIF1 isoform X3 [Myiozetetes cayanensis]|uniref:telomere-associated protein RIF1 isoform X3 n=1 Tax=Myiozetetes cayanensis TaxID=478635 RepID=UPI00216084A8|nr:telomere-associated protein RIF1 isoform X3 [Myiozetetes cayanensis]
MSAPDTATLSAPDTATATLSAPDTARAGPSLAPLLHTLQDPAAPPGELTDAHLTIVSRLSGEGGKAFSADVRKHFPQLCKVFKAHISSPNLELSNAALQALGFCTFNSANTAELSAAEMQDLLSAVNGVAVTSSDKNTRTRALWVISKQAFPPEIVQKEVSSILSTLETILTKGDVQSVVVEYEALNVIIRLMEQSPAQMAEEAVRWAKLIIPLVVHSAHKVQLRGATALEMGMPLLLQKQQEVAAVTEHLMTTKLISELQKLFSTKNETFVLKLWPLFVKLLGKTLHRSGSFINSLLQLEELGFRSGSPVVKKIAFIAWKSLIDNFALNPDILCSAKRLKLLMQPLSSIHVRTEALALTKLEVWWYLLVRLGTHLPSNFEQVCVPLIQSTLSVDPAAAFPGTPSRLPANQSLGSATPGQKAGPYPFVSPATPRINLNSSSSGMVVFPSIQLLGIEMLLHFLMGPAVLDFAKQNKLVLSLEPLQSPLLSSPSFFCKHASTLISAVQDGFIAVGKEVPDCMLNVIWKDINGYVKTAIESGNKKEKQGSEILTMLLQALKNTVRSSSLPVQKILSLIDITVKELPPKVLGSPAYQVADMDLLNGTPALFLIQLLFHNNLLECCVTDERFFVILETLVGCALSGPTSPLAFSESVICVINQSSKQVANKEHLWRMWSIVVNPLTEWINQTNEVNQGDALEHNFSAVYSALLLPVSHIFPTQGFPQPSMRSLLRSWAELYRAFARCAALVATAEDNVCCEELAAKVLAGLQGEAPGMFSMMEGLTHVVSVMVECINFAPYGTKYQPKTRSPQTPSDWSKKKKEEPLGKLSSLFKLLVTLLDSFHVLSPQESCWETLLSVGPSLLAALHTIISHISLPSLLATTLATFANPLAGFYEQTRLPEVPKVYSNLNNKLEKLLAEILQCLQSHCTGSYDSEMLEQLCPLLCAGFQHRSKQLRNQCAQFWNCTFAKAASLTYPEQLKSVLSQAKKKVPLLLPGFESIEMGEECSGPFSDTVNALMENSQLDAKISGMEVKLAQKRGSMLAHVSDQKTEGKDKSNNVQVTPAKLKLEFSSSKTPSEVLLEEEKSADFVFIPPETKARVLTEHQKEVLRSKRVDIPAMYNNLDASQDTTLFSQYTQSQEDSLEVSPLIENAKEDAESKPQEENARSEGCPSGESSAPTSEGESQNSTAQVTAEEPSAGEQLETSSVEAASKESSTGNENTSNVSNSSASSDVISGTPQPVSRRQSFITLEKFSGAESRPFSPSALPPFSEPAGGAALAGKQEQGGAKAEKPAEENKKPSKPEPEPVLAAIRRLTRRQSKMELQGNKSKVLNRSEQESLASDSMESTPELCSTVEDVEHILLSQSQALHSTDADIRKVEDTIAEIERARALDMDSKENTPPDTTISPDQATGEDTQVPQVSPQQKVLRRSLRRRSETAESSSGSQDKEDGIQRRDRRKEDDKAGQKKGAQPKDDGSQKQKGVSGRTAENTSAKESRQAGRAAEERSSKGSPASRGLDGEGSRSGRRAEEPLKAEGEGQDSSLKVVERPRYHTRRCAQGLLSSIENSEAEGSAKEESTRKKKHGKVKTRSDSLEGKLKDGQPGSHSQEVSSQGNETKSPLEANKGEAEVSTAEPCGLENQGIPPTAGEVVGSASPGNPPAAQSISEEQKQSDTVMESLPSPSVPEQDGTAAQESQEEEKQASPGGCAPAADASSLQTPQCHSKRSKRAKKSKNCDCCFKKPKQQITSLTESRKRKTPELDEPQSPPAQTPAGDSKLCEHSDLEESFSLAPCAMSTPVHPPEEPLGSQGMSVDELQGSSVGMEVEPGSAECSAGQTGDFIEEIKGPAHQKEPTEQVLPEGVPGEPGESCLAMESQGEGAAAPEKDGPATPEKERTVAPEREGPAAPEEEETAAPEKELSKAPEEEEPAVPEKEITVVPEKEGPLAPEREGPAAPEKEEPGAPEKGGPSTPEKEIIVAAEQEEPAAPEKDVPAAPEQEQPAAPVKKETAAPEQEEISQNGQLEEVPEELPVDSKPEEKEISNLKGNQDDEGEAEDTTGETCVIPEKEMKEELLETDITMPENVAVEDPRAESPLKAGGDSLVLVNESPTSIQARCTWSPSASPSTSILKRGAKRSHQDDDSLSPAHKIRRVSFADPIHQAGLADDIDRRSPVVRSHSSPSSRSLKILSNIQTKHITTPTKGFLSPGSRTLKFKSSKKCLITEMAKEPLPCPVEHVYPALAGCKAPVDVILPQLTSNICARGLGQLIRAKNIKTVGDLSCLTALEIKTLPIRSPKVSNLKRALKGYHEQQVKSRVLEEMVVLEDAEKPVNDVEDKPLCADEEKLGTEPTEPAVPAASEQPPADLLSQIQALSAQLSSQDLHSYSGSQLFEMQEKLAGMSTCILRNLQSRWKSPPPDSSQ